MEYRIDRVRVRSKVWIESELGVKYGSSQS